jgi:hypothetical protein
MAKAKQVQSWGDIPQATFEAFYKAVMKLREDMIPRDGDGDHPIDIQIVNRMTHEPLNYVAVPRDEVYSYVTHGYLKVHPDKQQEMTDETEQALNANIHMAADALDRHMRLKQHQNWQERVAKRPIADRIKEACPLCKKKAGFTNDTHDFYGHTREKYPDFPFKFHNDGEECKAFDLRRLQWEAKHPEYRGKSPAPRWCVNPDCRCKLPDYASKKGREDKNICVNPRCGRDNSKHYPEPQNAEE